MTTQKTMIDVRNSAIFTKLYGRYIGLLQFIAARFNVPKCESDELIQECFLRLFESDAQFISEDAVKGFLALTLKRQIIDRSRRSHVRKTESYDTGAPVVAGTPLWESDAGHEEQVAGVALAIEEISKNPGDQLFGWFYRDGLSAKEIADKAGVAIGSVTSKLSRLRNKKRQFILSCAAGTGASTGFASGMLQRA